MEFQANLEYRGRELLHTSKGNFYRYYFENSTGKGFSFVTKKDFSTLQKGKAYVLILNASNIYLNEIKGV